MKSDNIKIAYVLEKFPSPTEYFILNEILEFERNGTEISILVLRKQNRFSNLPDLNNLRATIYYLPKAYYYFPFIPIFLSLFSLRTYKLSISQLRFPGFKKHLRYFGIAKYFALKKFQAEQIHANFAFICLDVASHLSRLLMVPYSLTAHAQDIYTNQNNIIKHLPSIKYLITCTEYSRNYLNKLTDNQYKDKIYRVYHGTYIEKWPMKTTNVNTQNKLQILTIARLVEKKGLIYLIKAVENLINEGIPVNCTIIGQGELQLSLEKYIADKQLHKSVYIKPYVSQEEIRNYYLETDIFVLPCTICSNGDRDGLPNVILEAMLTGVPVISTPISAITEVIKHKETGMLVKEKDHISIAEGVKMLIGNSVLRKNIIQNARKEIEAKFKIESCTTQLIEIFSRLSI